MSLTTRLIETSRCVSNLASLLDERDVRLDAKRPFHVQLVLVELQQEDNQHEQRIEHNEREYGLVPQLNQIPGNSFLRDATGQDVHSDGSYVVGHADDMPREMGGLGRGTKGRNVISGWVLGVVTSCVVSS